MKNCQYTHSAHLFWCFVVGLLSASTSAAPNAYYTDCPGTVTNPVTLKGKHFFDSLGGYFPVKGIAYYPRPNNGTLMSYDSVDYFTDEYEDLWRADIANFEELGINTLRIYAVDPSQSHDNFMCALQQAGIYVIVGLLADCEDCGIGPNEAPSCYPTSLKTRGQWIINEFSKYPNTLLFSAGNEATLFAQGQQIDLNAACQKKFIRDMRSYTQTCSAVQNTILPRAVPIGMANWDAYRDVQTLYFNCRTDPDDELETPEWFGLNSYQHCDPEATSVDDLAGWIKLREDFIRYNLSVPTIISEYGCRERFDSIGDFEAQRTWLQMDALYSKAYLDVFAGGVVFEYSAEKLIADTSAQGNPWPYFGFMKLQYGVGFYSPVNCDHGDIPCEYNPYPEFDLLADKYNSIRTSFMPNRDTYQPLGDYYPDCPESIPFPGEYTWPTDDEPDLPCYVIVTNAPTDMPSASPPSAPSSEVTMSPAGGSVDGSLGAGGSTDGSLAVFGSIEPMTMMIVLSLFTFLIL
eukprot:Nitzschia sp. Nitz4//scaffold341_size29662//22473//24026//NITZ4_008042-RA/size29662-processed-gene-0.29-mRNA-1//-1//CDS//3329548558//2971//frame0